MDGTLSNVTNVKPYEDHAVVYTENEKSFIAHFGMFLELLMKLGLRILLKKLSFMQIQADFDNFPLAKRVSMFSARNGNWS